MIILFFLFKNKISFFFKKKFDNFEVFELL
jgi:hypothetical protein